MTPSEKLAAIKLADTIKGMGAAIDALAEAANDEDLPRGAFDLFNDSELSSKTSDLYDYLRSDGALSLLKGIQDFGDLAR